MKGVISFGDVGRRFGNLRELRIQVEGKVWVFADINDKELRFKIAPMGGYRGAGNYLRQWRKREGLTQEEAGTEFGISQSMIAKIENGDKPLPLYIFRRIHNDNRGYEKSPSAHGGNAKGRQIGTN